MQNVAISAACGLRFTDLRWLTFHSSKDFNSIIAPDKLTKQSRDLKCVYVLFIIHSHNRSPD